MISSIVVAHDGGVKQCHIAATLGRQSWRSEQAEGCCAHPKVLTYLLAEENVRTACLIEPTPGMLAPQNVLLEVLQVTLGMVALNCSYVR